MKPCRLEGEIRSLEVLGSIPKDIDGTFYRVMPDPQLPPFIQDDPVDNSNKILIQRLIEEDTVVQW